MGVPSSTFIHPEDEKALRVLKAVPGFALLTRAYMKAINERYGRFINMGNSIRVSSTQYPELYRMLPPICERLGIPESELYVKLDRDPNAYTFGDKRVCVVITSGLLEGFSKDEIYAVLAHECGHIACHHVLYLTIGLSITYSLGYILNFGPGVSFGIELALKRWMRCSELSADRAAAFFQGFSNRPL